MSKDVDFVIIDDDVKLGKGTKVWYFSHIQEGAEIGEDCCIGQNVNIGCNVSIGNGVKIQNNVSVYEGVCVEDDVFIGPSVVFTNVINPRAFIDRKSEFKSTVIKKGCSIGANATIICGITIGEYAMVGAGSVVSKSVTDYSIVYGNPARHKGYICECGVKLDYNLLDCDVCGNRYAVKIEGGLRKLNI